jgi:hypothetical protein
MPEHECETYDFPVKDGTFDYEFKKTVVKQLGGTGRQAVREAIAEAKDKATKEGEAAMKDETCAKPCERIIYVDVTIDNIAAQYTNAKKGKLTIEITGIWKAGILCIRRPG